MSNKYLPAKNFTAINLFGIVFARSEHKELKEYVLNHEKIHSYQILELGGIFYYVVYLLEWLVRLCQYRNSLDAYMNISFEREAYKNHSNPEYLQSRRRYAFKNYLRKQ